MRYNPATGPARMREVLGRFCSGITVITAKHSQGPIGFTCQSFSSVSLEPALVSFSPARTSKTWPAIREIGTFAVNILAEDHFGTSTAFSRSGSDKFAGIKWAPGANGAPILDGVVAWVECHLWAEHDGGDHTIVIAEVTDLQAKVDKAPLLYFRSDYHTAVPLAGTRRS